MTLPKRLSSYAVEIEILDKAVLAEDGLSYELPTRGQAVHVRQRLYTARKYANDPRYDRLKFNLHAESKTIEITKVRSEGILRDARGTEIPVILPPTEQERAAKAVDIDFSNLDLDGLDD